MQETVAHNQDDKTLVPQVSTAKRRDKTAATLTLAELQDLFQRAILHGDAAILKFIPGNERTDAETLFGVYQFAYRARLIECLGVDYPNLMHMLGQEAFHAMADAFITTYPSNTQNVRWVGRRLPQFLGEAEAYAKQPELKEMAALEQALANAFDAEDQAVLTMDDLAGVPAEAWAELQFTPHASAIQLNCSRNVHDIWLALESESDPPAVKEFAAPQHLVVWRKDEVARVRLLADEEAMMWTEASRGLPFASLCELAATYDDPDTAAMRAAQYLQGWIASGILTSSPAPASA